jgi:hypothetical protein
LQAHIRVFVVPSSPPKRKAIQEEGARIDVDVEPERVFWLCPTLMSEHRVVHPRDSDIFVAVYEIFDTSERGARLARKPLPTIPTAYTLYVVVKLPMPLKAFGDRVVFYPVPCRNNAPLVTERKDKNTLFTELGDIFTLFLRLDNKTKRNAVFDKEVCGIRNLPSPLRWHVDWVSRKNPIAHLSASI